MLTLLIILIGSSSLLSAMLESIKFDTEKKARSVILVNFDKRPEYNVTENKKNGLYKTISIVLKDTSCKRSDLIGNFQIEDSPINYMAVSQSGNNISLSFYSDNLQYYKIQEKGSQLKLIFEQKKERTSMGGLFTLNVTSDRSDFLVALNGKPLNFAPVTLENMEVADYDLFIGFSPPANEIIKTNSSESNGYSTLTVNSDRSDTYIKFDGKLIGKPPQKIEKIMGGSHEIALLTNISPSDHIRVSMLNINQIVPSYIKVGAGTPLLFDILEPASYEISLSIGKTLRYNLFSEINYKAIVGETGDDNLKFDLLSGYLGYTLPLAKKLFFKSGIGIGGILLYANNNYYSWNFILGGKINTEYNIYDNWFVDFGVDSAYGLKNVGNKNFVSLEPTLNLILHF